ncbi:replication protein A 32 kDa subunit-like protein [Leptotrombidium deliense]|uniref:Replication protein A 32 kDa subunit-like protein n=1 Tax=Leptotrombidium deliense TaxID=299467 RepID=A0A443RYJ9_9ACAR|nr:replication protein A 32 kDa subunit-like protein [Leptotrombidium deliense]
MFDDTDMFDDSGAGFMEIDANTADQSEIKAPTERTTRILVAVNIEMLKKYHTLEHGFIIHDQEVYAVTIVGQVESVSHQMSFSSFMLRDDCGLAIEVKLWIDQERYDIATAAPSIVENAMVRVNGQVRSKEGQVYISAFKVITVEEINEISNHNLEVMYHYKTMKSMKQKPILILTNIPEVDDHEVISGAVARLNKGP